MKKLLLITLLLLAPFCLQALDFQGITTATTDGDAGGLHEMSEMCDTAFSGSIMCSYEDIVNDPGTLTVDWTTNAAWVRPGKNYETPFVVSPYSQLDCAGWNSAGTTVKGLIYGTFGAGGFGTGGNCDETNKVACCK